MVVDLVDDFVVFEGETALLELVNQMDGKRDFSKVPNLIYRQNGKITVNQPFYSENINQLTAPNYDGFPLDLYLSPEPVLPVQFSRGCYYKDCAFCALTLDHQNFRQRDPGKDGGRFGLVERALWSAVLFLHRRMFRPLPH
jgi:anaerobic magnesium-protoporphyrin IX monomethyl ester cyclase